MDKGDRGLGTDVGGGTMIFVDLVSSLSNGGRDDLARLVRSVEGVSDCRDDCVGRSEVGQRDASGYSFVWRSTAWRRWRRCLKPAPWA